MRNHLSPIRLARPSTRVLAALTCLLLVAACGTTDVETGETDNDTSSSGADTGSTSADAGSNGAGSDGAGNDGAGSNGAGNDGAGSKDSASASSDAGATGQDVAAHGDAGPADTASSAPPTVHKSAKYAVETKTAVVYGKAVVQAAWGKKKGQQIELKLDTYAPKGHAGGLKPAMIMIHGGGFVGGNRKNGAMVAQSRYLAARGFFAASITYRLAGSEGPIPAVWAAAAAATPIPSIVKAMYLAGRDAKAAVRWLHANATKLGVDPNHIAIGGGSAGAYTAIGVGISKPSDLRDELTTQQDPTLATTHLKASAKISAIIDYWGGDGILQALSVTGDGKSRFDKNDPPLAIIHGTADPVVKFAEATKLKEAYEKSGAPFVYHPLKGAGHSAWNAKINGKTLNEFAFDFLVKHQKLKVIP